MKNKTSSKKVLKSALPRYPKLSAALKRRLTRAKPAPIKRTLGSQNRQVRRRDKVLWAAIWDTNDCGATKNDILVVNPILDFNDNPFKDKKGITIDSLAIFRRKSDAITFIDGNDEWSVMKIILTAA